MDRQFPGRTAHRAAAVAGGTVILAGGSTNERAFSDVWELEQVSTDKIRWVLRVANDTPPTREESAFGIASDARRGRLVLVSSNPNTCPWRSETWEWDGNASAWRDAGEGAKREPSGFAMAYVPTGQRLCVVTGGLVANNDCSPRGPTDKVTAWDGSRWGDHNVMPGARHLHAMTYDPVRDRLILFGGFDSVGTSAPRNQTWEATGQDLDWTIRTPATNPPFTIAAHMTYDEVRRRTVLLTQTTSGPEHWQWDGNNWTRVTPATPPPFGPLAFDALRARVVCNGDDELVWEWDGIDWRSRGASPTRGRLAYDSTRQEIVAVDRDGSVWYFGPTHAATYATFGTGCPGSRGIPALRGTQLPWIGCPFSITFDNLPAQPGIVWIGFSNSLWNTLPLPFDLSLIGISNCLLYTGIESSYPIANNAWSFNIPNLAALLGARFYNQALILDPGTNPFGAVVTNAGEAVIGGK